MNDKHPHVQAAFINSIREEGTKAEACDFLQEQWNETCAMIKERDAALAATERAVRAALEAAAIVADLEAQKLFTNMASAERDDDPDAELFYRSKRNTASDVYRAILAIRDNPASVAKIIEGAQDGRLPLGQG